MHENENDDMEVRGILHENDVMVISMLIHVVTDLQSRVKNLEEILDRRNYDVISLN
jgi:hypothetical protein